MTVAVQGGEDLTNHPQRGIPTIADRSVIASVVVQSGFAAVEIVGVGDFAEAEIFEGLARVEKVWPDFCV